MENGPYSARNDFLVHTHCCSLLERFFHPKAIPLARLVEACRSCTVYKGWQGCLIWGPNHDYGGIKSLRSEYPWEETKISGDLVRQRHPQDPWDIPELIRYLQRSRLDALTQDKPKRSKRARGTKWGHAKRHPAKLSILGDGVSNYFTKLPLEILEYILACTPTDAVKSLGRASKELKMIIPSKLGQYFWASRFQAPFECGFVFEAQTYEHGVDWKSLYFKMKSARSLRLKNRCRIWRLIYSLSELLCIQWSGSQALIPLDKEGSKRKWKEVHGDLQLPKKDQERSEFRLYQGCLQLYSQSTSIPTPLHHVVVSTIGLGSATYITGLRFITNQGSEVCLGYTKGRELSLETTRIEGIIVAVGSRGIHALRFITPTGQLSKWFGDPDGVLKTRRLAAYKPITALKAGFDLSLLGFLLIGY